MRGWKSKPNERKVLALSNALSEYFGLLKWCACFNSKSVLHIEKTDRKNTFGIFGCCGS
jgi:hypothetical protein